MPMILPIILTDIIEEGISKMKMKLEYYIYFDRSDRPEKFIFENIEEMFNLLPRYIIERGPIEWMQRIY